MLSSRNDPNPQDSQSSQSIPQPPKPPEFPEPSVPWRTFHFISSTLKTHMCQPFIFRYEGGCTTTSGETKHYCNSLMITQFENACSIN